MAHKNRAQLEKLIAYFDGKCDIIIHLDKGSGFTREDEVYLSRLSGVRHVSRKIAVHWGGYSLLRCQLHLLEQALRYSDCRYVHMLSGQDYPLKPLDDFLRFFGLSDKEFIEGAHLPAPHWDGNTYKRIQHYYFTDWFRLSGDAEIQKVWDFADRQDRWGIRRRIPDQVKHLYGGSAWFSLTRACAEAIIGYSRKHPSLLRRFRYTFARMSCTYRPWYAMWIFPANSSAVETCVSSIGPNPEPTIRQAWMRRSSMKSLRPVLFSRVNMNNRSARNCKSGRTNIWYVRKNGFAQGRELGLRGLSPAISLTPG